MQFQAVNLDSKVWTTRNDTSFTGCKRYGTTSFAERFVICNRHEGQSDTT